MTVYLRSTKPDPRLPVFQELAARLEVPHEVFTTPGSSVHISGVMASHRGAMIAEVTYEPGGQARAKFFAMTDGSWRIEGPPPEEWEPPIVVPHAVLSEALARAVGRLDAGDY
jgi:hypothetical protein